MRNATHLYTLKDIIHQHGIPSSQTKTNKIPWDDPDFSQRMLENHLSQDHDWASRRHIIIEKQTAWIHHVLGGAPSRILDLGCGPGLYLQQLAAMGHICTGIDFSPASINYACRQAARNQLTIDYRCDDIRNIVLNTQHDLVMMTFGEFNVFSHQDAQSLLKKIHTWLRPGGLLVLEVHTHNEVKRQGMEHNSWQTFLTGLFSAQPHIVLTENTWDETAQIASTLYWIMLISGEIQHFTSHMQAYSDSSYQQHLESSGFSQIVTVPPEAWPAGDIFTEKLYTYCCTAR